MASGDKLANHQIATRVNTATMAADTTGAAVTTETIILTVVGTLTSGRRYAIRGHARSSSTVSGDSVLFRIREDNLTGNATAVNRVWMDADSAGIGCDLYGEYTASATGAKTFVLTMIRRTGTSTGIVARTPAYVFIDEIVV